MARRPNKWTGTKATVWPPDRIEVWEEESGAGRTIGVLEEFGPVLKKRMHERCLTRTRLAKILDRSAMAVTKLFRRAEWSEGEARTVCKYVGLDLDEVMQPVE